MMSLCHRRSAGIAMATGRAQEAPPHTPSGPFSCCGDGNSETQRNGGGSRHGFVRGGEGDGKRGNSTWTQRIYGEQRPQSFK